jgi:K+-transporting ATPase A subunit
LRHILLILFLAGDMDKHRPDYFGRRADSEQIQIYAMVTVTEKVVQGVLMALENFSI